MKLKFFYIAVFVLLFTSLTEGVFMARWKSTAESPPNEWGKEPNEIPYKLAALRGDLPLNRNEHSLDFYRAIYPLSSSEVNQLSMTALLPKDGTIDVWLSSPPRRIRAGNRWVNPCDKDKMTPQCGGSSKFGVGITIERIGTPSIRAFRSTAQNQKELKCSGTTPEIGDEPIKIELANDQSKFRYKINDTWIECQTQVGDRPPLIRPGLREVHIRDLSVDGRLVAPQSEGRFKSVLISGVIFLFIVLPLRIGHSPWRYIGIALFPLMMTYPMGLLDWKSWIETMRAAWIPYRWMPVILSVMSSSFLTVFILSWRISIRPKLAHRHKAALILSSLLIPIIFYYKTELDVFLVLALVFPFLMSAFGHYQKIDSNLPIILSSYTLMGALISLLLVPETGNAIASAGLLMSTLGAFAWTQANAAHIRGYNLLSLLLVLLFAVSTEGLLSGTPAGKQWSESGALTEKNDLFGWVSSANEGFELLEAEEHTLYPDKGYPIAFDTVKSKQRVISFGGSTTGGAFQNDNLNQFYPAKLGRLLGANYDSINQGVGGWTTFHINKYIQSQAQLLQPDIAVLYIGHNDLLTASPLPYKDLYAQWESNPNRKALSSRFGRFHLYHALRHLMVSIRPANERAAVPISDAKENLLSIIEVFKPYNTKILLVSEGLAPDPGPLSEYNQMLEQMSVDFSNVAYIDAANRFHAYRSSQVFLDDCHLSDYGHQQLASWLSDAILDGGTNANTP